MGNVFAAAGTSLSRCNGAAQGLSAARRRQPLQRSAVGQTAAAVLAVRGAFSYAGLRAGPTPAARAAAYIEFMNSTATPLAALHGQRLRFEGLNCHVAGVGAPLLLLHSVNATASAAEVKPLFDHYRATHTVFALELPGFGLSDKPAQRYSARHMTDAVLATVAQIHRCCGPQPVDALALSLGCEFLARAASEHPTHFARLAFVSPTGLQGHKSLRQPAGSTREIPGLLTLLRQPLWEQRLYRALTRPAVVRHFLERTFGSQKIDEALWTHGVLSAQQPGARHAPLSFLSRRLFSADMHTVYESLQQPVWLSHGRRGSFTDFRALEILPALAPWRKTVFQTGALPHFELTGAFTDAYDAFMAGRPAAARERALGGRGVANAGAFVRN